MTAGLAFALIIGAPGVDALCAGVDSLCIHFGGAKGIIRLRGGKDYAMSGMLPVTLCNLYAGSKYRFFHEGYGLETRVGTFRVDGSGNPSVGGIRTGYGVRNAIIPGWGSIKAGKTWTGIDDIVSVVASAGDLVAANDEYRDRKSAYEALVNRLEHAGTADELRTLTWEVNTAAEMTNIQNTYQKRLLVFTAYLYGFQVIDPFISILPPRSKIEAGGSVVTVQPAEMSVMKAFLFSLFRPGRGQYYQGKTTRGVLYSWFFVAAGLATLEYQNRYDEEGARYNLAVEKFNQTTLMEEKYRYREEADIQWDAVEDAKRNRNISFIVLAGIWGLNLVDTFFPGEDDHARESRYSFDWSPNGGALVVRF